MKSSKRKYIFLLALSMLIALSVIGYYNKELISTYYNDKQARPFKTGDKIYAGKTYSLFSDSVQFLFFRLIRSKTSGEKAIIYSGVYIPVKTFTNRRSTHIGSFVNREFFWTDIKENGKNFTGVIPVYEVVPEKKV